MFNEDLFLTNETGRRLYHQYAENLPIIDYHCHLLPQEIYENKQFEDLGEMWLAHDHYKWRAMRTFGIDEDYITGAASFHDKYLKFAQILPQLIGNPIYIWCALELKRYFDIDEPLNAENAEDIYQRTAALIQERHMTPRYCMKISNVELVSTTEDPADSLEYHKKMMEEGTGSLKIISAFRPDKAFYVEKPAFRDYVPKLSQAAGTAISSFVDLLHALDQRLAYFASIGTMISDNGIEEFIWQDYTEPEIEGIFAKGLCGAPLSLDEISKYRSCFMVEAARLYHKHSFVMQLHIGTYQGANSVKELSVGVATGFDCTNDNTSVQSVGALLNRLTALDILPKTILYPLNAGQIETYAILAAAFCDSTARAKVQLGAPWWFNDQAYGIKRQFEAVANLYPISLSVGMLTDSRSFLSYPRHEVYRRVLCDYFGELIERGEYFSGGEELGKIIQNICYYNAKEFFGV